MNFEIREYRPTDEEEWMRVHAIILSISHAWNYTIQERPQYEDYRSTKLVAVADGRIVGLMDTQYENRAGEICFLKDSIGGYVLEFGRLPEYGGHGIGLAMIDATIADATRKGVRRLEFWTQERRAQRYYARLDRFKEIGRHYRFRMRAPEHIADTLLKNRVGIEYIYAVCLPEEWASVKEKFDVLKKHPLEPHLCIGYEIRF